jgi:hypothetical protein
MKEDTPIGQDVPVSADFYFAVIPEWVLALEVSSNAIRVYCCLRRFADNSTGECYPSRRLLAMRARISVSTLDRSIKELADHGAISIRHRKNSAGDYTSNLYVVHSFPRGVASKSVPPRLRGDATGLITGGEQTKATRTKAKNTATPRTNPNIEQWVIMGYNWARLGWSYSRVIEEYGDHEHRAHIVNGFLELAKPAQIDIPVSPELIAPKQEAEECIEPNEE